MKTKIAFLLLLVTTFSTTIVLTARAKSTTDYDYALNNIECLSNGEDGTAVRPCTTNIRESTSSSSFYLKCNSSTTASTIYPCPSSATQGFATTFTHCTK